MNKMKRYRNYGSQGNYYHIGELSSAGVLVYMYKGYFDDKSGTFMLYPQRGGYRASCADVNVTKKKIHYSEIE